MNMEVSRGHGWPRLPGLLATVGCACLGVHLGAYELVIRDVGMSVDYYAPSFDYKIVGDGITRSGSDAFDSGLGVTFSGMYSFTGAGQRHGLVAQAGVTLANYTYQSSGSMNTLGGFAGIGYGYALFERWDVHALARLGTGLVNVQFDKTDGFEAFSTKGVYVQYGVSAGISYLISDTWVARAEVGYDLSNTLLAESDGVDASFDISSPRVSLALYYRLTNMPWRLE